ncbi:MAG TPA: Tad domain-containing protein [Sphingomicrobium sp.]|jgi:Flp pilus assembly protein TadG
MFRFLKKLARDRRGNAIVIVAGVFPLFVGAAGLATDTIQWTLWKRQLQRAADSAAISGVYTSLKTDTDTAVTAAVTHDLTLNLHTWMALNATPTVTRLGTSGQMRNRVSVELQVKQSLPFSSMFMTAAPTIIARATAASVPSGGEYCVIGTDRSAAVTGIEISGSTYLDLGTCSLIANSANPTGAASNGTSSTNGGSGSTVKAASLDAAGGVNYSSQWQVSSYNPYSSPIDDPFSGFQSNIPSSSSGCNKTGTINKVGSTKDYNRSTDTATDTVCLSGDQTIQGDVVLGPATYVIDAGNLTMNTNGASLTCDGCTIILTNFSNPANTGTVSLTGGSISLKPPRPVYGSDGTTVTSTIGNQTWKGIVLYQDPRASDNGGTGQNKINGNSDLSVQGAVYFGNQSLQYVGGGSTTAACLQVVAKRVNFGGNSKIKAGSQCSGFGMSGLGGTRRVRLVA